MTLEHGTHVRTLRGQPGVVVTRGQDRVYLRVEDDDRCRTYLIEERVRDLEVVGAH
jgi:hypothetical protein